MELTSLQQQVDQWIKDHGVRYFNELTNMAQLTEEVGEVARIIARRYGEQSEKPSDKQKDLGEELADVLFVVLCLANQTGVDLQASFTQKMAIKTERDHDRRGPFQPARPRARHGGLVRSGTGWAGGSAKQRLSRRWPAASA